MKKFISVLIVMFAMMVSAGVYAAGDDINMDRHIADEANYWLNGVENDHQRYSAICGVYRQNTDEGVPKVVLIETMDKKGEVTGKLADNREIASNTTNDMDYVYMLAVVNLCGQIEDIITARTASMLSDSATDPVTKAIISVITNQAFSLGGDE